MTKTLLALSSVALVAALAGCGGSGSSGSAGPTANEIDQGVKFAQCMRKHGIEMDDPKPGDRGIRIKGGPGSEVKLKAAQEACKEYSPTQKGPRTMSAEELDQQTKLAQCLRRNGLDVDDPKPGQPFHVQSRQEDEQKTQKAMTTCHKEVGMPTPGSGQGKAGSSNSGSVG